MYFECDVSSWYGEELGEGYGHMDLNFMFLRESKKSRKRKEELFSPIDKFIYSIQQQKYND